MTEVKDLCGVKNADLKNAIVDARHDLNPGDMVIYYRGLCGFQGVDLQERRNIANSFNGIGYTLVSKPTRKIDRTKTLRKFNTEVWGDSREWEYMLQRVAT